MHTVLNTLLYFVIFFFAYGVHPWETWKKIFRFQKGKKTRDRNLELNDSTGREGTNQMALETDLNGSNISSGNNNLAGNQIKFTETNSVESNKSDDVIVGNDHVMEKQGQKLKKNPSKRATSVAFLGIKQKKEDANNNNNNTLQKPRSLSFSSVLQKGENSDNNKFQEENNIEDMENNMIKINMDHQNPENIKKSRFSFPNLFLKGTENSKQSIDRSLTEGKLKKNEKNEKRKSFY
jgi:hypothetical protein